MILQATACISPTYFSREGVIFRVDNDNAAQDHDASNPPGSGPDGHRAHVPTPPAKPPTAPSAGVPPLPGRTPPTAQADAGWTGKPLVRRTRKFRRTGKFRRIGRRLTERNRQRLINGSIIAAGLVLLGLIAWGLITVLNTGSPGGEASGNAPSPTPVQTSALPLPREGVSPLDFRVGDCFKDFDPSAPQSTVVACDTEHSAQLVAVHFYAPQDDYPGLTALREKGRETCENAELTAASGNYVLQQRNSYPSTTSWEKGDRRVDCYVTAEGGNVIKENLLPPGT
jgi:hypothetical protein